MTKKAKKRRLLRLRRTGGEYKLGSAQKAFVGEEIYLNHEHYLILRRPPLP